MLVFLWHSFYFVTGVTIGREAGCLILAGGWHAA